MLRLPKIVDIPTAYGDKPESDVASAADSDPDGDD
jgi:hypothetical protein